MNVSEKLRELWREDRMHLIEPALPLIADCIAQLEREHPEPHNYWLADGTMECPTCAALDALKEHLNAGH